MPSVPMEMPSLTPMVWNIRPLSLAAVTLALTRAARSFRCMLHGLPSQPVLATPTWALPMSSSEKPVAYSIALEAGWDTISVRRELYLLSLGVLDIMGNSWKRRTPNLENADQGAGAPRGGRW